MFRLLKLIVTLSAGAFLGFHFHGLLMKSECSAAGGTWGGTICLGAEGQQ